MSTTDARECQGQIDPWPLMKNNIARSDLDAVTHFLAQNDPILTQSTNVAAFEQEWSDWLGVKHSVMVNSGASANLITMAALSLTRGLGEVVVPTLTWVSDVASVIQSGFTPVFVDIDPKTLGMSTAEVLKCLSSRTRAVFLTHVLGFNAIEQALLDELSNRGIPLIEDVCESHGATFNGKKLGSIGLMSNFSFYYAHHLSTIEGGMVCTDDPDLYQLLRMLRSHGMVRECNSLALKQRYWSQHQDLNRDFIFAFPAFNVRSTEINAVIGRNQLKRLDENNRKRIENFKVFLENLDPSRYWTEFSTLGSCNYALTLILRDPDLQLRERVESLLRERQVEFRRGTSGGGNQLRQPYLRDRCVQRYDQFPVVDHIHFFGYYIGNYPDLKHERIVELCWLLNTI